MHASLWLTVRALTKLGTATVANNPIIATTIMISTRVKAAVLAVLIFMNYVLRFFRCKPHFSILRAMCMQTSFAPNAQIPILRPSACFKIPVWAPAPGFGVPPSAVSAPGRLKAGLQTQF